MKRVALVDPSELTLASLRAQLIEIKFVWLKECLRYDQFIELVQSTQPEIAIVSLDANKDEALRLVLALAATYPSLPILTISDDPLALVQSLQKGAATFLKRPIESQHLLLTLRRATAETLGDDSLRVGMSHRTTNHAGVLEPVEDTEWAENINVGGVRRYTGLPAMGSARRPTGASRSPGASGPTGAVPSRSVPVGVTPAGATKPTTTKPATTDRRVTVRYYSRMNPDRVFPLLVMLTRQEVEKIVKEHVEQVATGPIHIAKDVPLEIEPILPGCVCYPSKVVTRLRDADEGFAFHVVPHVQGKVMGARVLIRQDQVTLAEIQLSVRVTQRIWLMASGFSTFLLPAASVVMKHFGVDFTPKDGASAYLTALNFVFGVVPPPVLTGLLTTLTVALYLFTRPEGRDVFWDVSTKPSAGANEKPR